MKARTLDPVTFPFAGMALIEASAGTGKTYTIANLYLRLLLGDDHRPPLTVDRILVVTFTIAATEELRERVRQRIVVASEAFQAGGSDDEFIDGLVQACGDKRHACLRLDAARRQMDEAAIYTIHGFCHRALADNAFESGMGFELDMVLDETLLLQQAAEDFWRGHIATLDAPTVELLPKTWRSPEAVLKAVAPYLGSRPLVLVPPANWVGDEGSAIAQMVCELKQLWLADGLTEVLAALPFKGNSKYVKDPGRILAMQAFCESSALQFSCKDGKESWELWQRENLVKAMPKGRGDEIPEHRAFDLCAQLTEAYAAAGDQLRFYLLHTGIAFIADSMRNAKQQLGQLSPDDLLTRLHGALQRADSGARLARRLAEKYPQMLVDEFQDTDSIQYGIFEAIHSSRPDTGWTMIGDPKQAIYKFRGADVFTYIYARRKVVNGPGGLFTLGVNWRSSSAMVAAINGLFERAEQGDGGAFLYPDDIPFSPVAASAEADREPLLIDGESMVPVKFAYCCGEGDKGQLSSGKARQAMAQKAAMSIAGLLQAGLSRRATIGDRPLEPGDIAVLVRDRTEAAAVNTALAERGVNSVFLSRQSVFDSPVAIELYHVLQAVLYPVDERKLRSALATPLLGASMAEIAVLDEDVLALQALLDEFADYARHYARHGVLSTLRRLMASRDIPARLLAGEDGLRSLTDLRHLGELLQQASEATSGLHDLVRWYLRHISGERREDGESQRLRLESDSKLVKIVTIHASKGLEFNTVFLPLASIAKEPSEIIYQDDAGDGFVTVADLAASDEGVGKADKERLAEDLRLLYVALTRARHHCWVGVANLKKFKPVLPAGDSALAHVLGLPGGALEEAVLVDALEITVAAVGERRVELEVFDPQHTSYETVNWPAETEVLLSCPPLPRLPRDDWYLTSYSALARGKSTAALIGGAADETEAVVAEQGAGEEVFNPFTFPRGARYGNLLHSILEQLPFNGDRQTLVEVTHAQLANFGLSVDIWGAVVVEWMQAVLARSLPPLAGLSLQGLPESARISEMEFNFCLANTVSAADLGQLLRRHGYLGEGGVLSFADVSGVMRGFIDLVFEFEGHYYLLDYKSNYLGPAVEHYNEAAMVQSIVEHLYDLQYLIYCVAMHRYLAQRVAGYDYDRHFGGAYYLFLRGMVGADDGAAGVYYDKPPFALVEALDACFGKGADC